jgi:hypothetical protein
MCYGLALAIFMLSGTVKDCPTAPIVAGKVESSPGVCTVNILENGKIYTVDELCVAQGTANRTK